MLTCQYRKSHFENKTTPRPSYLYNGNHPINKDGLYIVGDPVLYDFPTYLDV